MTEYYHVSDFSIDQLSTGGAERSDYALKDYLKKLYGIEFKFINSYALFDVKPDAFYLIANWSLMHNVFRKKFVELKNYALIEHDYQFVTGPGNGRNPYMFHDAIVPPEFQGGLDMYANAKAIFFQTNLQRSLFERNNVKGNFITWGTTPYSEEEFEEFTEVLNNIQPPRNSGFAILNSDNHIKGRQQAIDICNFNKWNYQLLPCNLPHKEFLKALADFPALVFTPTTPESCSRLATEARILGLNVITTMNYGCVLEDWFSLRFEELVDKLRSITLDHIIPSVYNILPK